MIVSRKRQYSAVGATGCFLYSSVSRGEEVQGDTRRKT